MINKHEKSLCLFEAITMVTEVTRVEMSGSGFFKVKHAKELMARRLFTIISRKEIKSTFNEIAEYLDTSITNVMSYDQFDYKRHEPYYTQVLIKYHEIIEQSEKLKRNREELKLSNPFDVLRS